MPTHRTVGRGGWLLESWLGGVGWLLVLSQALRFDCYAGVDGSIDFDRIDRSNATGSRSAITVVDEAGAREPKAARGEADRPKRRSCSWERAHPFLLCLCPSQANASMTASLRPLEIRSTGAGRCAVECALRFELVVVSLLLLLTRLRCLRASVDDASWLRLWPGATGSPNTDTVPSLTISQGAARASPRSR